MNDVDISTFAGADHVGHKIVECRGDLANFQSIVEQTIAFARQYADVLGSGNLTAAYTLTGASLRARMPLDKYVAAHREAEAEFRGPALEYLIERFVYVLADDEARNDKQDKGWSKDVPRSDRRARLLGFWIRNRDKHTGCRGRMWITEEAGVYRLAEFDFYGD